MEQGVAVSFPFEVSDPGMDLVDQSECSVLTVPYFHKVRELLGLGLYRIVFPLKCQELPLEADLPQKRFVACGVLCRIRRLQLLLDRNIPNDMFRDRYHSL